MVRVSPVPCAAPKLTVHDAPLPQFNVTGVVAEPGEQFVPETRMGTPAGLLFSCTANAASLNVISQPSYRPLNPPDGSQDGEELDPATITCDPFTTNPLTESVPVYPR